MTAIRMIASDLDGTLLRDDKTVSARTLAALDRARAAGLIITFVTGRPPRWLAPVIHQTGWHGLAISANGAVLIDLEKQTVEETRPFESGALLHTISSIRELLPTVRFAAEHAHVGSAVPLVDPATTPASQAVEQVVGFSLSGKELFGHEPGYLGGDLGLPRAAREATIEEIVEPGDVVKLLARAPADHPDHADDVAHTIQAALIDDATVTHSTTSGVLLEISAAGVNKATGLSHLARMHGVDQSQVVAVGDMPNDIAMLEWAGNGYAVGNAHAKVREATGFNLLPSNEEDGVARLIENIVAGRSR